MKDLEKILLICNVLKIAIFGALAYAFNHWWIILFAVFFLTTYKED